MAELYTLGNFTIDDIVLHDGRTWIDQVGGNVLYSALGAQIWHKSVGILARLGNNVPENYLATIGALDLELQLIRVAAPMIHDWALYEADGARQFVNHVCSGTNESMSIRADEIPEGCRNARAYHIAPMPTAIQRELVHALKQSNTLVSLDLHEWWIKGFEPMLLEMMHHVDFFMPSRHEAHELLGSDDPERAAREFARVGKAVVVIKLGADGSLVYDRATSQLAHIPIYPAEAMDVTGAGDAFCGGFLAGYLETGNAIQAACYGTVSASFCVENLGAVPVKRATREEAERRLEMLLEQLDASKRVAQS